MSSGITLGLLNTQLSTRMTDLSRQTADAARESAEGVPDDVGAAQPKRFGELVSHSADLARAEAYEANAEGFVRRADVKQTSMTEIVDAGQELLNLSTSQLPLDNADEPPASYDPEVFAQTASGILERLISAFNVSDGQGFLFSGVDADRPPLSDLDEPGPSGLTPQQAIDAQVAANPPVDAAGAANLVAAFDDMFNDGATPANPDEDFTGAFYQGAPAGGQRVTVTIDDGATASMGLQADDEGARELLQGVYMLAAVDLEAMSPEAFSAYAQEAVDRIASGLDAMRAAQAELGSAQQKAEAAQERNTAEIQVIREDMAGIREVDSYEAQLRYTRLENQLNLLYEIVSRTSRLNLFQFIR